MVAQRGDVLGHGRGAGLVGRRRGRAHVGVERKLGVDDDVAPAGQVHDEVRHAPAAVLGLRADLLVVLAALGEPRQLEDALDHELAPVAAGLALALERGGERVGFRGDLLVELVQLGDLRRERDAVARLVLVGLLDLVLEAGQALAQRLEQGLEVVAVLLGEALRLVLEDVGRQLAEARLELRELLGAAAALEVERGAGGGELGLQAGVGGGGAGARQQVAERSAKGERDESEQSGGQGHGVNLPQRRLIT